MTAVCKEELYVARSLQLKAPHSMSVWLTKGFLDSLGCTADTNGRLSTSEGGEVGETVIRPRNVGVAWEGEELDGNADEGWVDRGSSRGRGRRHRDGIHMTSPQKGGKEDGKAGHGWRCRGCGSKDGVPSFTDITKRPSEPYIPARFVVGEGSVKKQVDRV